MKMGETYSLQLAIPTHHYIQYSLLALSVFAYFFFSFLKSNRISSKYYAAAAAISKHQNNTWKGC